MQCWVILNKLYIFNYFLHRYFVHNIWPKYQFFSHSTLQMSDLIKCIVFKICRQLFSIIVFLDHSYETIYLNQLVLNIKLIKSKNWCLIFISMDKKGNHNQSKNILLAVPFSHTAPWKSFLLVDFQGNLKTSYKYPHIFIVGWSTSKLLELLIVEA